MKSTSKTLQNGYFDFLSRWPHIFYMIFKKSYDLFRDFWSKYFWNILKICLITCEEIFKLIILKSSAENIKNITFYLIKICPRLFFRSCLYSKSYSLSFLVFLQRNYNPLLVYIEEYNDKLELNFELNLGSNATRTQWNRFFKII